MSSNNLFELVLLERPYKNYDSNEVEHYSKSIRLTKHLCVNEVQAVIGPTTLYTSSPYYIEFRCNGKSEYHKFNVSHYTSKLKPAITYLKGDVVKFRTQYSSEVPYDERRQILLRGFYFTTQENPAKTPAPQQKLALGPLQERQLNVFHPGYETTPKNYVQDSSLEKTFSEMESMLDKTVNEVADWTKPTTKSTEQKNDKKSRRSFYQFQYSENNRANRKDGERRSLPETSNPTTMAIKIQPVSTVTSSNDKKREEKEYKAIKVPDAPYKSKPIPYKSKPIVVQSADLNASVICTDCNKRKPGVVYEFALREPGDTKKTKSTLAVGCESMPYLDKFVSTVYNGYVDRPDINVIGKAYVSEQNAKGVKGISVASEVEGRVDGTVDGGKRMTNDFRSKSYVSEIEANQGDVAVKIRNEKLAYESIMKTANNTKHVRFTSEYERYEYK